MQNPIPDIETRILWDQNGLLVFNKPPRIPTSGRSLDDPDAVQYWLEQHLGCRIWAVHQLDADTSGLNLFVKEKSLVKKYKQLLESPQTQKEYLAIVHGAPVWERCCCRAPIGKIDARSLGVTHSCKHCESNIKVLQRGVSAAGLYFSLLKVSIKTGRTHQIRIHLSHLGHPLVGEEWYKNPPCDLHYRQALHATRLKLANEQEFFCEFPTELKQLNKQLFNN